MDEIYYLTGGNTSDKNTSDQYNLIHRHNLNNYFLCKVVSFGDKTLLRTR